MAIDLSLPHDLTDAEPSAEIALEHALSAWRTARARFERVDPSKLPGELRDRYARALIAIGLWSDAKVSVAPAGDANAVVEADESVEDENASDEDP